MTETATTLLSVRADSTLEVAPDAATIWCGVTVIEADKTSALGVLGQWTDAATSALAALGGVARSAGEARHALSWSVRSVRSENEMRWNERQQVHEHTGRTIGSADLTVVVREFSLLDQVSAALGGLDQVEVRGVGWSVDDDNPGWPQVRAAAIDAALAKGRDYAAALGGTIRTVEHVADLGLLGDSGVLEREAFAAGAAGVRTASGKRASGPSLDPVPQELRAGIEARFTASIGPVKS